MSRPWNELEQCGKTSGKIEGKIEGGANVLLAQAAKICGTISEESKQRIRDLNFDQLQMLAEDLLGFHSLADLETWLEQHGRSTGKTDDGK